MTVAALYVQRGGVCSCGIAELHEIARRRTADGHDVCLWSDGMVTRALGYHIRGVGRRRAKPVEHELRIGWAVLDAAGVYDADELAELVGRYRRAFDANTDAKEARRAPRSRSRSGIVLRWTVYSADRDGRASVRYAALDRIRWPALVLWHERGLYSVLRRRSTQGRASSTLDTTGFEARTLREILGALETLRIKTKEEAI